ncbi:4'-phosphopantetheinyl transferase superfamily protein [Janibacter sp. GXQ6167]|uniref:4'-phosphopantetheinyl transferase family protein n=1 Tax=Janibacter sp. GXQ6167 TaxID=3240791 RepID=UPI003524FA5F
MPARVVVTTCPVIDDPSLLAVLDASEVERADRKREPSPYISAHALMRRAIGATLEVDPRGLRFERRCATCGSDRHGKPHIVDRPDWSFSLSYTGRAAVVALSPDGEVGVDVEEIAEADFGGFDQVTLAASELDAFADLTGEALLVARAQVWARKEAILKATGHGLVVDPTEVVVTGPLEPAALVDWQADPEPPQAVALSDLERVPEGHRAAVAVLAEGPIEVIWQGEG